MSRIGGVSAQHLYAPFPTRPTGQVNALQFVYDYFVENFGEVDERFLSECPLFDISSELCSRSAGS